VVDRRDGQWVHYSLSKEAITDYAPLLELLANSLNDDKTILKDKENLRRAIKIGPKISRC